MGLSIDFYLKRLFGHGQEVTMIMKHTVVAALRYWVMFIGEFVDELRVFAACDTMCSEAFGWATLGKDSLNLMSCT